MDLGYMYPFRFIHVLRLIPPGAGHSRAPSGAFRVLPATGFVVDCPSDENEIVREKPEFNASVLQFAG
jgi:hypothetical protein